MNTTVEAMVKAYNPITSYAKKNTMKEIMQEIVLCGLSRSGFFKEAAFYGGTALRIFYGLDRFSEDLDFSLMQKQSDFAMTEYFPTLEREVRSFGLNVQIDKREKTVESNIQSAFLKGNTKEHLLLFYPEDADLTNVPANEIIKIKFEVDVNPPEYAGFEKKYRLRPMPYEVNMYDEASLFAGKIHAVLGRSWKNRAKGRDIYDYIFYLSKNAKVNLKHLQARLIQSGHLGVDKEFSIDILKEQLRNRFAGIDYAQAKADVLPFIQNAEVLNVWNAAFFTQITEELKEE